jgi:transcriptional regulator with XRE-family HTH domain
MERPVFDYAKLKGRIKEKCDTQKAFASMLGIAECTLIAKLECKRYFTQTEIYKSLEILEIPFDRMYAYFFTPKVHKCEQ